MPKFFKLSILLIAFFLGAFQSYGIEYKIFEESGKVGLKDNYGKILIPAVYDDLGWSNGSQKPVNQVLGFQLNNLWGLISLENKRIITPVYTRLYPFGNQLFAASRSGKVSNFDYFGLINANGKIAVPFKYTSIKPGENAAIVTLKNGSQIKYGVTSLGGSEIIPNRYKDINLIGNVYAITNFEGRVSVYRNDGLPLSEFIYTGAKELNSKYTAVEANNGFGLYSATSLVKPAVYKDIYCKNDEVYLLPFNSWDILTLKNETLRSYTFDELKPMSNYYITTSNNRTWVINEYGEPMTNMTATELVFQENGFVAIKQNKRWGLLDRKFRNVIKLIYDSVYMDSGLVFCRDNYKQWSIFDTLGLKKSEYQYEKVGSKTDYFWPVKRRGHWGFIDQSGEEVVHPVYDHVGEFISGKVVVGFHGEQGVIDKESEWIILPSKADLTLLNDDLYISRTNQLKVLKSIDAGTIYFSENPIEIKEDYLLEKLADGRIWKIDFNGRIENNEPRDERFEEIRPPSEGLFPVKIDGLYGFIDRQNRLIIANRYNDVGDFNEGLAPFKLRGKWGFIDKKERIVVQPLYGQVSAFLNGTAIVQKDELYYLIDKTGKTLNSRGYASISSTSDGRFITEINALQGLMDDQGRLLINNRYESLHQLKNGHVITQKNSKFGLITDEGVDVIPALYDQLIYDSHRDQYLGMKKSTPLKVALR